MAKILKNFNPTAILVVFLLTGLTLLATMPLSWTDQLIVGVALYGFCAYLHSTSRSYRVTLVLMILSIFSTGRYCMWRYLETWRFMEVQGSDAISIDLIFVTLLLGAESYAALILVLGYFQGLKPLGRKPIPLPDDITKWPTVDVFIPTYNEPLDIVKPTVMAALNMDYPADKFQVYILDDGRRDEFRQFAEEYGVVHVTRKDNRHAKAGNINAALKNTTRELVAIFDCDHVPTRSFLQLTVGWFLSDQKLGMVQTPHHFYSPDPFEKNLDIFNEVPNESALFYGIVQDGNDLWNATFFCGSCAVIRRPALEEIGGVAVETVTEDAHTSLRMQRNAWNTAYINIPQAAGLATSSMADHIGQRIRWARGMVQILRVDTPLFGKGLSMAQRLCYFNSVVHYLYAVPRLIFLTAPLVFLLIGLSNMYGSVVTIMAYGLPHLALATLTNSRIQGKHRHSFWNEVYETVLAPYILLPTLAALINPKWGSFNVTAKTLKSERTYLDWRVAAPFAALLLLNLAGITIGFNKIAGDSEQLAAVGINIFWSSLNVVVLAAAVASAIEKKQLRLSIRIPAGIPVSFELPNRETVLTTTVDISIGGAGLQLDRRAELQAGDLLNLRFEVRGEQRLVPAIVIKSDEKVLRVAYHHLTLAQQETVALLVYSRADFWNRWRRTGEDRPLYSFLRILEIAMRGIVAIPASIFGSITEASKTQAAAANSRRRPVYSVLLLVAILAALLATRAPAQAIPTPQPPARSSNGANPPAFQASASFKDASQKGSIELQGRDASAAFRFAIPMTQLATDAQLTLRYRLGPAFDPEGSRVDVTLNGSGVGSIPLVLSTANELAEARLALPAELLTSGNELSFHFIGQCHECATKDQQQLLTSLDASSEVQYSGVILPLANDLALLPQPFFDPMMQSRSRIGVHFMAPPDRDTITAAAVLTSWIGSLSEKIDTEFRVSGKELPSGNLLVIADRSRADFSSLRCGIPDGMTATICNHPADPAGKLLVIAGNSPAETLAAARAFAAAPARKGRSASFAGWTASPRPAYDAPRWLRAGERAPFKQFSHSGQLTISGTGSAKLYFRLAPDLHYGKRGMVPLRVGFRWRKFPPDLSAKLRVTMNGVLIAKRSFQGADLGKAFRETMQIPVSALYPRNTLTFDLEVPETSRSPKPELEILPDSSLDLGGVQHFAEMPRLDLFAKAGFPFTRRPDLSETAIVLPVAAPAAQIALALNAAAFLGSQTGSAGLLVSFIAPGEVATIRGKDLLVVSMSQDQMEPQALAGIIPFVYQDGGIRLNEPHNIFNRLIKIPWFGRARESRRAQEFLNSDAPIQAILQGAGRIADSGRSVVQLLAVSTQDIDGVFAAIENAAATDDIFGNASLQRGGQFTSFRLSEDPYAVGNLNQMQAFDYWMTKYLLLIPIFVIICTLPLTHLIESLVERKRKERLQFQTDATT